MPDNFDGFLRITNSAGQPVISESKDPDHRTWIDIETISFGCEVSDVTTDENQKLAKVGRGRLQPVTFSGGMHKGSPVIFQYCVTGEQIDKMEFHARTSGGGKAFTFLRIWLERCLITSVNYSTDDYALPTETITVAYGKILMEYAEQGQKGDAAGGVVSGEYDVATEPE
jgi:type VI secretion system secreted protein Hcp